MTHITKKTITVNNKQLETMYESLQKMMSISGFLGYIIAMNYEKIKIPYTIFMQQKQALLIKYGTRDEQNNSYEINPNDENWKDFLNEFEPIYISNFELEILVNINIEYLNCLTAEQIINISWMIDEEENQNE